MTALALLLVLTLPGFVLARALFHQDGAAGERALSYGERLFLPVAISVLVSSWVGLGLAEAGMFSLWLLAALVALLSAVIWLVRRGHLVPWPLWPPPRDRYAVAFVVAFAIALFLVARPAEYVLGNYDAGVYVNIGINLAQTGAITIHDPLVAALPADPSRQFFWDLVNPFMLYKQVRLPGFFVADAGAGRVMPQFLHLYPVWLAIFDAGLGFRLGLYATPLIGLLGSIAAFFLAKELFGRRVALLAFFLLVISVPQFWFARYPVSEGFCQFLILTGLYGMARFVRGREDPFATAFALLAGVALGALLLTRGDMILFWAPLGLYFLYVLFSRTWRREHWAFFGAFGLLQVQALAHMIVFAPDYIYFQYTHALRTRNINWLLGGYDSIPTVDEFLSDPRYRLVLGGALGAGVVLLGVADRLVQWGRRRIAASAFYRAWVGTPREARVGSWVRWGLALAVVFLFAYAYLVWPQVKSVLAYIGDETPLDRSANLVKVGWYVSPVGLMLAVLGVVVVLRRKLTIAHLFFLGASLLFAYVYVEELYSNPHYIYTMRRYVPLVIPALMILAALALTWLWERDAAPNLQEGANSRPLSPLEEGAKITIREAYPPASFPSRSRILYRSGKGSQTVGPAARKPPAWARLGPIFAALLLFSWLAYDAYAMGLVDGTRAQGFAVRVPFLRTEAHLGPLRLEPFEKAIAGFSELDGALEQIEALAAQIPPDAVAILVNNRDEPATIATPLKYAFGRDVLVARFNQPNGEKIAALVDVWRAAGRPVYLLYGVNGGKLALPRYALTPAGHYSLDVPQWAFAYQYMPRGAWRVNLNYVLYRAEPRRTAVDYPFEVDFGGDDAPVTAGGFLERPPEAHSRWSGQILDPSSGAAAPRAGQAALRLPLNASASRLTLALEMRAPRAGAFLVKSGDKEVGRGTLSTEFQTFRFTLDRTQLQAEGDTFLLTVETELVRDPEGRLVGAEFQSLRIEVAP